MDPLTIAAVGSSVAGGLGSIFGRKRPKPPKELGEIARAVKALADGLPESPEQLDRIASIIQSASQQLGLPPTQLLQDISNHFGPDLAGASVDFSRDSMGRGQKAAGGLDKLGREFSSLAAEAGRESTREGAAARKLYNDGYSDVERQAAQDALRVGSAASQQARGRVAADRSESALSAALGQQIEAARARGVAPSAAAIINPAATAAGADVIARSAYDAEEQERRLGLEMRRGLLGTADRIAGRGGARDTAAAQFGGLSGDLLEGGARAGIGLADSAAAALRRSAALGGDLQDLNLAPRRAEYDFTSARNQELGRGFDAHKTAYDSKLDENFGKARLYGQSYENFQGKHDAATDYWAGRTKDIQGGIENIFSGAGKLNFGGGVSGGVGKGAAIGKGKISMLEGLRR